jgi:phage/plasmid-like protein (TIGR03299 family)
MAHELEMVGEKASMAFAGEVPWHNLGTKVDPSTTPYLMLKAAGLNWNVEKLPLHAHRRNKKTEEIDLIEVPTRQALVRSTDNKVLTIVSDDWEPVQNYEAFKFFNEFIFAGDMEMHTAGSLRGGNMVWALAKVKEQFSLFRGKDTVESYLLFSNPHEYGKSITVQFTPIRVVCANTLGLSLSMKSDTMVRLNHRKKFDADSVKRMLGIAKQKLHTYEEVAKLMASKRYNADALIEFYNTVFPTNKEFDEKDDIEDRMSRPARVAYSVLETQPGHQFGEGTWWQAFNSVTYTCDHLLGHSDDTRMNSAWYGGNRERKLRAMEKAVELAQAA